MTLLGKTPQSSRNKESPTVQLHRHGRRLYQNRGREKDDR